MARSIFCIVTFLLSWPWSLHAIDFKDVEYVRTYDGDTIFVNLPGVSPLFGGEIGVRVRGIDAPEIRSECETEKEHAQKAKDAVSSLVIGSKVVTLHNAKRGKYFRIVADVSIGGVDVAEYLIEQNLARPYDGGKRQSWCMK